MSLISNKKYTMSRPSIGISNNMKLKCRALPPTALKHKPRRNSRYPQPSLENQVSFFEIMRKRVPGFDLRKRLQPIQGLQPVRMQSLTQG